MPFQLRVLSRVSRGSSLDSCYHVSRAHRVLRRKGTWELPFQLRCESCSLCTFRGFVRKRNSLIIVYSNVATPFSRCRAFCRWLLRAGHRTLPAERFRRMRGGIFGCEAQPDTSETRFL
eukprot:6195204-Pleurochrysis_carterae.AAC.1